MCKTRHACVEATEFYCALRRLVCSPLRSIASFAGAEADISSSSSTVAGHELPPPPALAWLPRVFAGQCTSLRSLAVSALNSAGLSVVAALTAGEALSQLVCQGYHLHLALPIMAALSRTSALAGRLVSFSATPLISAWLGAPREAQRLPVYRSGDTQLAHRAVSATNSVGSPPRAPSDFDDSSLELLGVRDRTGPTSPTPRMPPNHQPTDTLDDDLPRKRGKSKRVREAEEEDGSIAEGAARLGKRPKEEKEKTTKLDKRVAKASEERKLLHTVTSGQLSSQPFYSSADATGNTPLCTTPTTSAIIATAASPATSHSAAIIATAASLAISHTAAIIASATSSATSHATEVDDPASSVVTTAAGNDATVSGTAATNASISASVCGDVAGGMEGAAGSLDVATVAVLSQESSASSLSDRALRWFYSRRRRRLRRRAGPLRAKQPTGCRRRRR
eukprot:GHVT01049433.1.p2 GENE.GHVT01049433.1~~GHVT01049433.1.p2  ORF type:complete len:451 (-),score=87.12 GHVT01049433.1:725-2077(-)